MKAKPAITTRIAFIAATLSAVVAVAPAYADRSIENLMTMDHHLLSSDFVGVVRVRSAALNDTGDVPHQAFEVDVEETWFSRWPATSRLTIAATHQVQPLEVAARYVVLLAGGRWHHSPFTHRNNSVFVVADDGTVHCSSGVPLFGVMTEGFLCTAPELVDGAPITLSDMHSQFERARTRAARRRPDLDSRIAQGLEIAPDRFAPEEIRR